VSGFATVNPPNYMRIGVVVLAGGLIGLSVSTLDTLLIPLVIAAVPLLALLVARLAGRVTDRRRQFFERRRQSFDRRTLTVETLGFASLAIGVATSSWNGLRAGPGLAVCDVFFVLAGVLWVVSASLHRPGHFQLPWWLLGGAYILALDAFFATAASEASSGSLVPAIRLVVALLLTPALVGVYCRSQQRLRILVISWVFSASVNALVGVIDYFGHAGIGRALTGSVTLERTAGLTTQSNHLAIACVFALPFALLLCFESTRKAQRLLYLGSSALLLVGVLVSGSRGGTVAAVVVVLILPLVFPPLRRRLAVFVSALLIAMVVLLSTTSSLVAIQRLTGSASAQSGIQVSDTERAEVRAGAIREIDASPFYGVGFAEVRAAHSVYLQLLSAGGPLAIIGYLVFAVGAAGSSWRFVRTSGAARFTLAVAAAACATLIAWLLLGFVENQLYDRYLLVPTGLFVGCLFASRTSTRVAPATIRQPRIEPETA